MSLRLCLLLPWLCLGLWGNAQAELPNVPIERIDLNRYLGTWHEVARLPNRFQKNCVSDTTATYAAGDNGEIVVRNACMTDKGESTSVDGVARVVVPGSGKLKVRFAPRWLAWLPVWAPYWVVDLDPDYRWAVVGGPTRKYLWILSRDPVLDAEVFAGIKTRAAARGYAVDRLTIPQMPRGEAAASVSNGR